MKIIRDSNLIVMQVKQQFSYKDERLTRYMDAVHLARKYFIAIYLKLVLKAHNQHAYALVFFVSNLSPFEGLVKEGKMGIVFIPSMFRNMGHWKVFEDDE